MYLQIQIATIDGYSSLFSGVTVVLGRLDLNAEPLSVAVRVTCLGISTWGSLSPTRFDRRSNVLADGMERTIGLGWDRVRY